MFQHSEGNATIRIGAHHQFSPGVAPSLIGIEMPEPQNSSTAGGRAPLSKKILLTLLVLAQVCFISCLWLLQAGGSFKTSVNHIILNDGGTNVVSVMHRAAALHNIKRVNFITKTQAFATANTALDKSTILKNDFSPAVMENNQSGKASDFRKDFYRKTIRLNKTIDLINGTGLVPEQNNEVVWCFREGSFDEHSMLTKSDTAQTDALFMREEDVECKCRTGWHGRDCGQPEIIWRTLLKAKTQIQLRQPSEKIESNRLVYLLEGNFFNLDLLDLQISTLTDIVDYFIIFVKPTHGNLKPLNHWLREKLADNQYLIFLCDNQFLTNSNCTTEKAYEYFRQQQEQLAWVLKPSDLLLYTNDQVLLSRQALQFLKYYATNVRSVPFRLKYVVYGFYWQHPEQTQLNGFISSFAHVDNPSQIGVKGRDPSEIMQQILKESTATPPFVIGDLNHFGGWLCKYCQQPEEIVSELHAESNFSSQVQFLNALRNRNIDVPYLQKLIATGIYVDGKTQLLRIRRYSDKYYSPTLAEAEKAKYGNLLVNLYESFDDEIEYEAGVY